MTSARFLQLGLLLLILPCTSLGDLQVVSGTVVRVIDGDTIEIDTGPTRERIRFAAIDAPERDQPWGEAATREVRRQLAGREITVLSHKRDKWQRRIGSVMLDREDIGLSLVQLGLAWHYKRYAGEQTATERDRYAEAENAARQKRKGLWSDPSPIPPWTWRRSRR